VQVSGAGTSALPVEEKTLSYVRKEFRATAEARRRPPLVAEAMVDPDVVIPGVIDKGKLLTLTTDEALRLKVADHRADTLQQALAVLGLANAEVRRAEPNWAENVVRILTQPFVASLLVTIARVGIVVELRTPGFALPGVLGMGALALVLWGHWLAQLAGLEEALLVAAGLLLLALEMLVIPGFGVAGVLGIIALVAGLVLGMTGEGNTASLLTLVAARLVFSVLVAIGLSLVMLRFLSRLPGGRRLILDTQLDAGHGYASPPPDDAHWLGRHGTAHSVLRPAGIAEIDGHRVDVVSEGEMIDAGTPIEVTRVDGNRIVVRAQPASSFSVQQQGNNP
jgi:membrane-bound serine protease (ClpP class)